MTRAPVVLAATTGVVAFALSFQTGQRPASRGTVIQQQAASRTQVVDGGVAPNQYGDVQVRVTVRGGRITAVEYLQLPIGDRKSREISDYSGPALVAQTLAAQSTQIDGVSGATYTTDGYVASLQSALDAIHFAG
jgi:uncharacterized protein with FMN-binding domain